MNVNAFCLVNARDCLLVCLSLFMVVIHGKCACSCDLRDTLSMCTHMYSMCVYALFHECVFSDAVRKRVCVCVCVCVCVAEFSTRRDFEGEELSPVLTSIIKDVALSGTLR